MATYGYIRVSTLQQANDGDSLETQLKQIGSYASLKGFELPDEHYITERGVSGSIEFEKRPASDISTRTPTPLLARFVINVRRPLCE